MSHFALSTELLPPHDGPVAAVAVIAGSTIVTGSDDGLVRMWTPVHDGVGPAMYAESGIAAEAEGPIRALLAVAPGAAASYPDGGVFVGSQDTHIRGYTPDGILVRTLSGHTGGVVSLAWSASGALLSGAWDGTARVWNIIDGTCLLTLGGHENGVCVCGLPNGDIVTGAAARCLAVVDGCACVVLLLLLLLLLLYVWVGCGWGGWEWVAFASTFRGCACASRQHRAEIRGGEARRLQVRWLCKCALSVAADMRRAAQDSNFSGWRYSGAACHVGSGVGADS